MRVFVTGATGFVGPAIVRRLVEDGHTVRVLEHTAGSSATLPQGSSGWMCAPTTAAGLSVASSPRASCSAPER